MNREASWPLAGFTALSPLTIGGLAGLLMVRGTPGDGVDGAAIALLGIALLALLASALHLGRPLRAYRSIARLSTSWLSREVILFGIFVLLLVVYALPVLPGGWGEGRGVLGILATAAGGMSLFATGEVYRLPSRPSWNSWRTVALLALGALGAGLPLGAFVGQLGLTGPSGLPTAVTALSAAALLLGVAITGLRIRRPDPGQVEEFAAWQVVVGPCRWLLVLRLAGALCATGLLFAATPLPIFAWIPAAIGEMADRTLFFRAVVPVSMARRAGILPFEPVAVVEGPAPSGREVA
ncbi:MAG TPA: DmsC/YnfH family molybdoenzyme membrane anchor subunit [Candidatus Methylomirabilis sp.]|nr:DmsC/YnfH family molybdoenzyme membrane anchor subunit [Candidatus Methylomirabilis sp.]